MVFDLFIFIAWQWKQGLGFGVTKYAFLFCLQCETDPTQGDEVSDYFILDIASVPTVKKYYKGISHFETYLVINKSFWNFNTVSFYSVLKKLAVLLSLILNLTFRFFFIRTKAAQGAIQEEIPEAQTRKTLLSCKIWQTFYTASKDRKTYEN